MDGPNDYEKRQRSQFPVTNLIDFSLLCALALSVSVLFGSVLTVETTNNNKKCLADDAVRWWYCSSLVDCVLLELLVVFVTNGWGKLSRSNIFIPFHPVSSVSLFCFIFAFFNQPSFDHLLYFTHVLWFSLEMGGRCELVDGDDDDEMLVWRCRWRLLVFILLTFT